MQDAIHSKGPALSELEIDAAKSQRHLEDLKVEMAALATIAKPSPWTRNMIKLYLILIPGFICSTINGFDGSLMGGINGIPS